MAETTRAATFLDGQKISTNLDDIFRCAAELPAITGGKRLHGLLLQSC
jgi:hypothetical protein